MKRALIIGGSRGLGLGLVREHLARGWHVTATYRTASPELEASGASTLPLDVTDAAGIAALAERLNGQKFDLLFVNPGIMASRQPLSAAAPADIDAMLLVNAIAPIRVADALAGCVAAGGTVAFMTSILGSIGTNEDGRMELYRASKAALNSLIRSFRARLPEAGITVLALHPGVVRTSMGGPNAPLDIDTSVRGLADTIAARQGSGGVAFVDYRNQVIPW